MSCSLITTPVPFTVTAGGTVSVPFNILYNYEGIGPFSILFAVGSAVVTIGDASVDVTPDLCGVPGNTAVCTSAQICATVDSVGPLCYPVCSTTVPCASGACMPVAGTGVPGGYVVVPLGSQANLATILHVCIPAGTGGSGGAGNAGAGGASNGGATAGGGAATAGTAGSGVAGGGTPSTGGTATGGTATGGTAVGGTATGGTATGGTAVGGTSAGGTATGGTPSTGGASMGGTPAGGTSTGGSPSGGTATGGTAVGGTSTGGTATAGAGGLPPGNVVIEFTPPVTFGGVAYVPSGLILSGWYGNISWTEICNPMVSVSGTTLFACGLNLGAGMDFYGQVSMNIPYGLNGCTYTGTSQPAPMATIFYGDRSTGPCGGQGAFVGTVTVLVNGVGVAIDPRDSAVSANACTGSYCNFHFRA